MKRIKHSGKIVSKFIKGNNNNNQNFFYTAEFHGGNTIEKLTLLELSNLKDFSLKNRISTSK